MEVIWLLFSSYGFIQCDVLWKLCGSYLVVMALFSVMYNGSYMALI